MHIVDHGMYVCMLTSTQPNGVFNRNHFQQRGGASGGGSGWIRHNDSFKTRQTPPLFMFPRKIRLALLASLCLAYEGVLYGKRCGQDVKPLDGKKSKHLHPEGATQQQQPQVGVVTVS